MQKEKTVVITGGSRGIGLAIGLRLAKEGANIVVLTKEAPSFDLATVSEQIAAEGGKALVLDVDIRDEKAIKEAVELAVKKFGGVNVLVNNTSATCFTNTEKTTAVQFDLALSTSARAAFFTVQACLPYLKKAKNPHIINISPPLNLDPACFKDHLAFSVAKYAMSLCTLGMAEEFREFGIAVNSLWPQTTIATQAIENHFVDKVYQSSRWPSIMGDAAFALLQKTCTGQFFTDETLLKEAGMRDFSSYAVDSKSPLTQALFIPTEKDRVHLSQDLFLRSS